MADDTPKEERTFEPTAKRLREFREEGRVAVSKDLANAAQLLGVMFAFLMAGNALLGGLAGALAWTIDHVGEGGGARLELGDVVAAHLHTLTGPTLALMGILLVSTLIAYFAQTRLMFSAKLIGFKWNRLNPMSRLADIASPTKAAVRVGLALGKLGLTAFAVTLVLAEVLPKISALGLGTLEGAASVAGAQLSKLLVVTLAVLGVLAVLDFLWQRKQLNEQLRMTREEVKKENEQEDGRPEIKARRRQKHRELSMNRMMAEVPKATVVITNPTHYAVALRYEPGKDRAPTVVAKGVDEVAVHIRAIARRAGVPIMENRSLARALWSTVKVGKAIPQSLFQQVAQVLAQVYRARTKRVNVR
ncbi:MAG: EscU/YscU/HrcU family type III secretion system export apparatus switch protein [Deltaproteobacteria bacterium]|nr:EscU/YscU/HrcU family type III secretion system export apparatus switch protein [Deltaproteobacteria bacterium]